MVPPVLPELFSNYLELHAAQLGALLGLFVGLLYRDYPRVAYALLFLGVLSAFGNAPDIGYANEINVKPWYFLTALYFTTIGHLLLLTRGRVVAARLREAVARSRPSKTANERTKTQ